MENAAEALKIFFGVTIFALALTVFFRMTSLAKDTADVVFSAIDQTTLINYNADTTNKGNRVVTIQEILPTIFRYAQEGYGVTIVDGADIIARFDLDTELQVSSCFWNNDYDRASDMEQKKSNKIKYELGNYLNKYIYEELGMDSVKINLPDADKKEERFDYNDLDRIIKRIYGTGDTIDPVYSGWLKSNSYNNSYVAQRINTDLYGGMAYFNLRNPGLNDTIDVEGIHKAVCEGNGLLEKYTEDEYATFTEYIVQIDTNNYVRDEEGEETDLLVFGEIRKTKKREIIYVKTEV